MASNTQGLSKFLAVAGLAVPLSIVPSVAQAQSWDYAVDGVHDDAGVTHNGYRQSFDMLGMGIKDDGENVYVGILSKLNHTGMNIDRVGEWDVANNNIGYGDFFFDFSSGGNYRDNINNGNVIGVKFLQGNDSDPYVSTGVYNNIQAAGVQGYNAGYGNVGRYKNAITSFGRGQNVTFGDLAWDDDYWGVYRDSTYSYGREWQPNILTGGDRIGDVSFLNYSALYDQGFSLDSFSSTDNSYLFGFQISRSLLPDGNFVATFLQECLNDGMALLGHLNPFDNGDDTPEVPDTEVPDDEVPDTEVPDDEVPDTEIPDVDIEVPTTTPQSVPEPSSLLGIAGIAFLLSRRKQRK